MGMAKRRKPDYLITRAACVAIMASAAEVFPKECMGTVCVRSLTPRILEVAIPYQLARRQLEAVTSNSSSAFDKLFSTGLYDKFGDFHSHPFLSSEELLPLEPSETDLKQLRVGDVEVIVRARRTVRNSDTWRITSEGISISWGRFRFLISAFRRIQGTDATGCPLYKRLRLCLTE